MYHHPNLFITELMFVDQMLPLMFFWRSLVPEMSYFLHFAAVFFGWFILATWKKAIAVHFHQLEPPQNQQNQLPKKHGTFLRFPGDLFSKQSEKSRYISYTIHIPETNCGSQ